MLFYGTYGSEFGIYEFRDDENSKRFLPYITSIELEELKSRVSKLEERIRKLENGMLSLQN